MKLYDLGHLPGQYSMLVFHALARQGEEGLVIVSPETPLVSIGYFQDLKGVDLDYCQSHGISVMRRELGGGTTLLDRNQVFYQVVLRRDNPLVPRDIDLLYRRFSAPVIETYGRFGIETRFKPINDIVTAGGRKISGEGGGDIGGCIVFVGGILMDFDFELMARVLRVPSEKFRDKMYQNMADNMSTMKRELGFLPERQEVVNTLAWAFEDILGPLERADLPQGTLELASSLEKEFAAEEFFDLYRPKQEWLRIGAGVSMQHGMYKAPGGLVQTVTTIRDGVIEDIILTGDFTLYPKHVLTQITDAIRNVPFNVDEVRRALTTTLAEGQIQLPGVDENDLCRAIFGEGSI